MYQYYAFEFTSETILWFFYVICEPYVWTMIFLMYMVYFQILFHDTKTNYSNHLKNYLNPDDFEDFVIHIKSN